MENQKNQKWNKGMNAITTRAQNFLRGVTWDKAIASLQTIGTLGVLWYAITQSDSAVRSAKSAEDAVKVAEKTLKFSEESFQKNIGIIRDQFEVDNRPYLFVADFDGIYFKIGEHAALRPRVVNLNKYPVKVISQRATFFPMEGVPTRKEAINFFNKKIEEVVSAETSMFIATQPQANLITSFEVVDGKFYEDVISKKKSFFFGLEYAYINLVNHNEMKFYFLCKISGSNLGAIDIVDVGNR